MSLVFIKVNRSGVNFLILYVDNILLIRNNNLLLLSVKIWLFKNFFMKDMEETTYIPGIKIYMDRSKSLLLLSQFTYIDKMLKQFSIEESKREYLPILYEIRLSKNMCPKT
jgi:hypothetical protein